MKPASEYSDVIAGIIVAFLAVLLWYLSSLAIVNGVMPRTFDYAASFGTAITGTFLGAFLAFRFNAKKQEQLKTLEEVQGLRSALFTLILQLNLIGNVCRNLEVQKDATNRYLLKPAKLGDYHQFKRVEISSLEFLLKTDPNKLMELSITQDRFDTAVEVMADRLEFHRDELQPAIEQARVDSENAFDPGNANDKLVIAKLGERLWALAKNHDDNVYTHIPDALDTIQTELLELLDCAKRLFPDHVFVDYTFTPPEAD